MYSLNTDRPVSEHHQAVGISLAQLYSEKNLLAFWNKKRDGVTHTLNRTVGISAPWTCRSIRGRENGVITSSVTPRASSRVFRAKVLGPPPPPEQELGPHALMPLGTGLNWVLTVTVQTALGDHEMMLPVCRKGGHLLIPGRKHIIWESCRHFCELQN